jgi:hypothetical protein
MSDYARYLEVALPTASLELKHPRGYVNKQIEKLRIRSDKSVILSPRRLMRKSERNLELSLSIATSVESAHAIRLPDLAFCS